MLTANLHGHRMPPIKGLPGATCPTCAAPVVAKCGRVNVWHWAHQAGADCDPWAERDSAWHQGWQATVPAERREVTLGNHRADMLSATGVIIEVQHSNLSVDEIREREDYYGRMVWIFDAVDAATPTHPGDPSSARLDLRTSSKNADPAYRTFRWKHARKSLGACRKQVFLDLGDDRILRLGWIRTGAPVGGWGHLLTKQQLVEHINDAAARP